MDLFGQCKRPYEIWYSYFREIPVHNVIGTCLSLLKFICTVDEYYIFLDTD